ncbi:Proteasome subunit beta type [Spironucleus salmonicida]|uniref:Proteasome subunit beta type n=1 Tax=Spironucleus salmonicida TaxID=348837 RepID=V6LLU2_9EUKA|nr:Proteasome subunit beta type [Spironucleus salmonicida]|eukprot:EST45163.1 Proteasome subunit beta type [Spironucleus salmonicida]
MSHDDRFNPYTDNGGTTMAIAGDGFVVIGSDTRASEGYGILSRHAPKTYKVTDKAMIAMAGMRVDATHLHQKLSLEAKNFKYQNGEQITVDELARLMSVNLYYRRFFPWYTFNIVAGLDQNNQAKLYAYDAVGCIGSYQYTAAGSGESLGIGILDQELMPIVTRKATSEITVDKAVDLMKKAYFAIAEREIYTGDTLQYYIIDSTGMHEHKYELRKD